MSKYATTEYKRLRKENPTLTMQEALALTFRYVDAITDRLAIQERRIEKKHGVRASDAFRFAHNEEWSAWNELYYLREKGYISNRF